MLIGSDTNWLVVAALGFLQFLPLIGSAIGALAGGRQKGREAETAAQQNQARTQADIYQSLVNAIMQRERLGMDQAQLGAQRAQFERDSPNVRFGQAMRGNLAANVQDVGVQAPGQLGRHMVQFSGGLRPSALGQGGREAGAQLAQLAQSRMGNDSFSVPQGLPQLPAPPRLAPLPRANWFDKFLGAVGPAASIGGMFGGQFPGLFGGRPRPQPGELPEDDLVY